MMVERINVHKKKRSDVAGLGLIFGKGQKRKWG
jgi:hypothetical protein